MEVLFEIADPRGMVAAMYAPQLRFAVKDCLNDDRNLTLVPKSAVMILFPSWLIHSVTAYKGSKTRISIAFNLALPDPSHVSPWNK